MREPERQPITCGADEVPFAVSDGDTTDNGRMSRREKISLLIVAALIPAIGIPVGVALGLSDNAILGSLFGVAAVAAVAPELWRLRRRGRAGKTE